ncbi:MAG: DNA primase [Spirochaetaceae bacterium]|jgi:DNA primase|nr:DNA primase [Spirochaetaceae bacterium]
MAYISEATIAEVQGRADIVSVIGEYVRLEKRGGRYWGLCPFHNEKTPSFSVDPDRKMYYCFGCHKGGGVINFLMETEKLSYPEAIESLAKKLSVNIVYENHGGPSRDDTERERKSEALEELYRRVAGSFQHILLKKPEGSAAKQYIRDRGISEEMTEQFRLGFAPADRYWLYGFLSKKGYSDDFLRQSGLFAKNNSKASFFFGRLIFPISDRRGRTVAFGGRTLRDGQNEPKYINSAESDYYKKRETLFAIDLALGDIRKTREAYLAEGYMDVIALHQGGIRNAVAPLGTAFTTEQAKLLGRWAETVYIIFDADSAGQSAAVKAIFILRNSGLSVRLVDIQKGLLDYLGGRDTGQDPAKIKDPADILRNFGPEALQKSVKCFITDFEYLLNRSRSLFDISVSEGASRGVAFLFPYLDTLDSEVARDSAVQRMAEFFGADPLAIRRDYRNRKTGSPAQKTAPGASGLRMNDELFLLISVFVNHELYPKLRSEVLLEEVKDPEARELFIALEEWYRNNAPGIDDLFNRIELPELKRFVMEQAGSDAFKVNPEIAVTDGIRRIKEKGLENRRKEIIRELRMVRSGSRTDELLLEKVHIDAELRRIKEAKE